MSLRVAVIGAGMAGLACARQLVQKGHEVTVFDKGRSLGGRCATRDYGDAAFDHGAQYVTAHSDAFRDYLESAVAQGHAAVWKPAHSDILQRDLDAQLERWYVGNPGMNALVKPLAEGIAVSHIRIMGIERRGAVWFLEPVGMEYDALVLAIPVPQILPFLNGHSFTEPLSAVRYLPCWTGMVGFESRIAGADVLRFETGNVEWIARNTSKPARETAGNDCWVLHASPAWSLENIDRDKTDLAPEFYGMLTAAMGIPLPPPAKLVAHLWRYARVEKTLGQDFLWDEAQKLGVCGDFCIGARVEAAFTSGHALGTAV